MPWDKLCIYCKRFVPAALWKVLETFNGDYLLCELIWHWHLYHGVRLRTLCAGVVYGYMLIQHLPNRVFILVGFVALGNVRHIVTNVSSACLDAFIHVCYTNFSMFCSWWQNKNVRFVFYVLENKFLNFIFLKKKRKPIFS